MTKHNKKSGVVGDLINGTGGLIVAVVIVLVIVSTVLGANLLRTNAVTSTVTNESQLTVQLAYLNATGYTLASYYTNAHDYSIVAVWESNDTGYPYNLTVPTANYTLSNGVLTNATAATAGNISVTYTYINNTAEERASDNMAANFTQGIDNVSAKVPTILLIGAVVLLFGVLVLLIMQARKSGMFGSGQSSL